MAEIGRVSTPPAGKMKVIGQADNVARPSSSGSVTRQVKKMPSEGLISLSPEPGRVKFESSATAQPSSGRASSAGHTERQLLLARKKEELLDESDVQMFKRHSSESSLAKEMDSLAIGKKPISSDPDRNTEIAKAAETSSDSSDTESSSEESDTEEGKPSADGDKVQAPVELKGDFLKAVMEEDFEKAKELCQKILLLEPDNATCMEFHAVITEKIKQDEVEDESSGSETDDSDDSDETDDEEADDADDAEDSDESSDESSEDDSDDDYIPPTGPINLIMGGLPIIPQSR